MRIRRAQRKDVAAVHAIIEAYAAQGMLLPRTREQIERGIGNYLVAADEGSVAGCVALETYGGSLAEIRSLAVAPGARGAGIGGKLLDAAMKQAKRGKISRLLAVTGSKGFFERQGFRRLRGGMPAEKVERDCVHCSKAATCRLEALAMDLTPARSVLTVLQPGRLPVAQPATA